MTIKDKINKIARIIYGAIGYTVRPGHDFSVATHPTEQSCWVAATEVWEEITGDTPDLNADYED